MYIPTDYGSFPLVAEAGAKMGNQLLSINTAKQPEGSGAGAGGRRPLPAGLGSGDAEGSVEAAAGQRPCSCNDHRRQPGVPGLEITAPGEPATPLLAAFRADTGERVWSAKAGANIAGGSATYTLNGEQYVAVLAGGGAAGGDYWAPNNARLLVYKLGGKATLPAPAAYTRAPLNPPPDFGDDAMRARGQAKYNENCGSCHGNDGRVGSLFPDLRYAGAAQPRAVQGHRDRRRVHSPMAWCRSARCCPPRMPKRSAPMWSASPMS